MSLVAVKCMIAAKPEVVWNAVMDPYRLERWVTIHRRLLSTDHPPLRPGFQMRQLLALRGIKIEVVWTLVRCEKARLAIWEGKGPARSRAHTEYRLEPREGATCFRYRNEFFPPLGLLGTVASRALVGGISEREAKRSLAKLKALVETGVS